MWCRCSNFFILMQMSEELIIECDNNANRRAFVIYADVSIYLDVI